MKLRKPACLYVVVLLAGFFIVMPASAQMYLLRSKKAVIRMFHQYEAKSKINIVENKADNTVQLQVRDSSFRKLDVTCYFNAKNKCYKQTKTTDCAECFDKYFAEVMKMKSYGWKKVSDHLYISKPFWATALLIDPAVPFSFSLVQEHFSRNEHKQLYEGLKQ